jgi:hypothetical protein
VVDVAGDTKTFREVVEVVKEHGGAWMGGGGEGKESG